MRNCNSTNFDGGHFENGVPQVVHPNLVTASSTFHVRTSPRKTKIGLMRSWGGGSIGPMDYVIEYARVGLVHNANRHGCFNCFLHEQNNHLLF